MQRRTIYVIPHTHWDREWYLTFQSYRLKLVDAIDELIEAMEANPEFRYFHLDGQMAVVDDYLEIRPENYKRLVNLSARKRLGLGPWYILMDEFLSSGETIIRNLQLGTFRAAEFGGALPLGYLPDMFGHIQQMPQLLNLAGIKKAVVWRGVPRAINYHRFWWQSPDGSRVLTEYLYDGYSTGAGIINDSNHFINLVKDQLNRAGDFFSSDEDFLILNGTDHLPPRTFLPSLISEANNLQEEFYFKIVSWEEYLIERSDNLPTFKGELRSSARANLLMGVASNHLDVKKAANEAEIKLERLAEPLWAFSQNLNKDNQYNAQPLFDLAWRNLILNSAHDSSCACSIDEVVRETLVRYQNAKDIASGLITKSAALIARNFSQTGAFVINLSSHPRAFLVSNISGESSDSHVTTQRSLNDSATPYESGTLTLKASDVKAILSQINSTSFDGVNHVHSVLVDVKDVIRVTILTSKEPNEFFSLEQTKLELAKTLDEYPQLNVEVKFQSASKSSVLGYVSEVDGFGWKKVEFSEPPRKIKLKSYSDDKVEISDSSKELIIDPERGTFSLNGLDGFNQIVDEGDDGDTYNYSPPVNDKVISDPVKTKVEVLEEGPLRARVEISRVFLWPEGIDSSSLQRVGLRETNVRSLIEINCSDDLVRIHTEFKNFSRDHRVRAIFPLANPASYSEAGCAFSIVRRGIIAERGDSERGLATYPSRHFVKAGGLTLIQTGLPEYELIDIDQNLSEPVAKKLALTLLRATGMLSKITTSYRPFAAGPAVKASTAQMQGDVVCDYAVTTIDRNPYELVDQFLIPSIVLHSVSSNGVLKESGSFIKVEGAEVSSLRTVKDFYELRVFNPFNSTTELKVNKKGWVIDLQGCMLEPFDGSLTLGPFKIVTLLLAHDGIN